MKDASESIGRWRKRYLKARKRDSMSKTTISVSYSEKRSLPNYCSHDSFVSISFETEIGPDAERELMQRVQRAQAFCKEAVLRELVPPSEHLTKFRELLATVEDQERLDKASAYVSKLFADGKIDRREAAIMDEEIEDKSALLAAAQVTLAGGDGTEPTAETVARLKKQMNLMTGDEVK